MKRILSVIVFVVALFISAHFAHAYGPFVVADDGSGPMTWINNTVSWHYDPGDLSSTVDNAKAVNWITEALDQWVNATMIDPDDFNNFLSVATVTHVNMGPLNTDVTAQNIEGAYYFEGMQGFIVFDEDGSIIEDGFGYGEGVLGLTQPYGFDETGKYITRGIVILNGKLTADLTEAEFKSAITHEIGHLLNMDHSMSNAQYVPEDILLGEGFDYSQNIPTMYPVLVTAKQGSIVTDDKIGLGWIYPDSSFQNKHCTIRGQIQDKDGNPLQGVNVVARYLGGEQSSKVDVRSMISGAMNPSCTGNGEYVLQGIKPGRSYQVTYEKIHEAFVGASGFEPFPCTGDEYGDANGVLDPHELCPPYNIPTGTITRGGETAVSCNSGGDEITMDTVQLEVANPCDQVGQTVGPTEEGFGEVQPSGKCSLSKDISPRAAIHLIIAVFATIALILIRRRSLGKSRTCQF